MLSKLFSVLFSGTQQAIDTISKGQADLKKQIKSAICIIEGIQASQARLDLVPVEIATVKNAYDQVMSDVSKIKSESDASERLIWAEIEAIKNTHTIEIDCQLINPVTIPEKISFNREYLESVLKTFDCETITICLNSEIQPVIITAQKYDDRQSMIMPIKP